jgi:hypothetical protein
MKALICSLLLTAFTLTAGDLTGKWRGKLDVTTSDGDTRSDEAYMDLKVNGTQVTGTIAINPDHPFTVQNGKLKAGKLTFEALMEDRIVFDLVFDGDTIHGSATGTAGGGEKISAKVDLKRAN